MSEEFLILTDEPVKVRDSWDLLDTPRTSQSESDNFQSNRQLWFEEPHSERNEHLRVKREDEVGKTRTSTAKGERGGILKTRTKTFNKIIPTANRSDASQRLGLLFNESRPVSAQSFTEAPKTVPKRYRKLGLRNHEEMLQEEMDQLRHLLNESENMSKEELGRQHIAQTANMIADYKAVNRGVGKKGVIVSRSLPESLRPKSPRSSCDSSYTSSSHRRSGYSSSRSPSADSRIDAKRVSFRQTSRRSGSTHSSSSRERSNSPKGKSRVAREFKQKNDVGDEKLRKARSLRQIPQCTDYKLSGNTMKGKQSTQHQYLSSTAEDRKISSRKTNMVDLENSDFLVFTDEQRAKHGVIEDINGCKHSDNNLKRTSNPDIKRWLREKEKAIKEMKKKQKEAEKKEQAAKELELKKKEEREKESAKQLRQWTRSKRKEARLLRRKNQAKQKLEPQESITGGEAKPAEKSVSPDNTTTPTRPPVSLRRPQSAPISRRKVKAPQVPISQVIKTSPDLQERLRQLEKQKRLKHRQTYDEWVKVKEREKRDTMKIIREQRKQLEKEITEETARVISEAAKRRIDNVRYKGSTTPRTEPTSQTGDSNAKEEKLQQGAYTWKREDSNQTNPCNTGNRRNTTVRSAPMPTPPRRPASSKPKPSKPNVEEKMANDNKNPFQDPFKPNKQRRPKSRLEEDGINGPEFSRFIWELVNEEENSSNRPEPQGADSPEKSNEPTPTEKSNLKTPPKPRQSASPMPPANKAESPDRKASNETANDPVIENGKSIFSMTSIE